jgi:hypothetical protein
MMAESESIASIPGPMLAAALAYAKKGWSVFPCAPRSKIPATLHGFKDATTDARQIKRWWRDNPEYNVAIATGPVSGLFVFDVDDKPGRSIDEALGELPKLPEAPTVRTGGGGFQYFWAYPEGSDLSISAGKLGPGFDTRGKGGYVVASPSIHPNGQPYRWYEFEDAPLPATPDWMIARLAEHKATSVLSSAEKLTGGRHDTLMTAAALMRSSGFVPAEIYAAISKLCERLDLSDGRVIADKELQDIASWTAPKDMGMVNIQSVTEGAAIAAGMQAMQAMQPKAQPQAGFHIQGPEEWRRPLPKREWLVEGMLPRGGVGLFASAPGKGKSLMLVEIAEAVALGRTFGPFQTKPGKVLYCAPDSPLSTQYRLQGVSAEAAANIFFAPTITIPDDFFKLLALPDGQRYDFALIIIDTYDRARKHSGGGSAEQDALVYRVVGAARDYAHQTGAVPLFSHHTTRGDEERPRGSQSFDGLCDMIGAISQMSPGTTSLSCLKMRDGEMFQPLTWDIKTRPGLTDEDDDVPFLSPSAAQTMEAAAKALKAEVLETQIRMALDADPSLALSERRLADVTRIKRSTLQRILAKMNAET